MSTNLAYQDVFREELINGEMVAMSPAMIWKLLVDWAAAVLLKYKISSAENQSKLSLKRLAAA